MNTTVKGAIIGTIGVVSIVTFLFAFVNMVDYVNRESDKASKDKKDLQKTDTEYTLRASRLVDYYYRQNIPVRFSVIKETLIAIDYYLSHYFPDGPFIAKDFIAIAMVESSFSQYLVGTSGEKGIFQIMDESSKYMGVKKNQFDIDINTELSMFVLQSKFEKYQDYRKAIIAYNGVVIIGGNKWSDIYWKKFSKARTDVDILFKDEIRR